MSRNDTRVLGAAIPGYALGGLAVAVAVTGALLLSAPAGWVAIVGMLSLVGALWPQTGGGWFAAAGLVVVLLLNEPDPGRAAVAIAAVHLLHVLAALAAVVPLRAQVAVRALIPTGIRFAGIQAICQGAHLAVHLLPRGPAVPAAALAGAGAVLLLAVLGGRLLRTRRGRAHPTARPGRVAGRISGLGEP